MQSGYVVRMQNIELRPQHSKVVFLQYSNFDSTATSKLLICSLTFRNITQKCSGCCYQLSPAHRICNVIYRLSTEWTSEIGKRLSTKHDDIILLLTWHGLSSMMYFLFPTSTKAPTIHWHICFWNIVYKTLIDQWYSGSSLSSSSLPEVTGSSSEERESVRERLFILQCF